MLVVILEMVYPETKEGPEPFRSTAFFLKKLKGTGYFLLVICLSQLAPVGRVAVSSSPN